MICDRSAASREICAARSSATTRSRCSARAQRNSAAITVNAAQSDPQTSRWNRARRMSSIWDISCMTVIETRRIVSDKIRVLTIKSKSAPRKSRSSPSINGTACAR
jgi:hypothetical protein